MGDVDVVTREEYNRESEEPKEQQHWQTNKQENIISAKELFQNEHPWFTNRDENNAKQEEKVISLQEYLKDESSSWWDARNSPPKDVSIVGNLKKSSLDVPYNNISEDSG